MHFPARADSILFLSILGHKISVLKSPAWGVHLIDIIGRASDRPYSPLSHGGHIVHAKPHTHGFHCQAWRGKTKLFWSPGTIWPPCDKGELELSLQAHFLLIKTTCKRGLSVNSIQNDPLASFMWQNR